MSRRYVFADEAGNFDFRTTPGASRYFILTTVTLDDCAVGDAPVALRRELAWEGLPLEPYFHATDERQEVRDRVFALLTRYELRIDTTVFNKPKAHLHLQSNPDRFYRTAWHAHMRHLAPRIVGETDELLVIAASIGTKRQRTNFHQSITSVISAVASSTAYRTAFWSAGTDPCLQIADYCCWAIQRKWERNDSRSYTLIEDKLASEYNFFQWSAVRYY